MAHPSVESIHLPCPRASRIVCAPALVGTVVFALGPRSLASPLRSSARWRDAIARL
jgi:hypothetical protein